MVGIKRKIMDDLMKSIRQYKMGHNTVIFDYVSTIVGAMLLSKYSEVPLVVTTVVLLVLGEVLHYVFNVPTNTLRYFEIL